ncbi:sugar-binding transcriptional regulator [Pseudomonas moraviensis subsp. stanleyae]|nr:sugar-binding transcriptional regulator [Pseudomonas moraviensis subsp. stanleyae]
MQSSKQELMAKVAWLYFVGNNTQQEIAQRLNISRPTINRMIAGASESGLVQVRINHPIRRCMELGEELKKRYGLSMCEVAPLEVDDDGESQRRIAVLGAALMDRYLSDPGLSVIAMGFGRTLKAVVGEITEIRAPQLNIISLAGSVSLDGSFNTYDVGLRLADKTAGKAFLLPMPVIAKTTEERDEWLDNRLFTLIKKLYSDAEVSFVGIGDVQPNSPLVQNGFLSSEEALQLMNEGAVGEILGWAMDRHGNPVRKGWSERVTSLPLPSLVKRPVIAFAGGRKKVPAILAALRGRWISGLITDQITAQELALL